MNNMFYFIVPVFVIRYLLVYLMSRKKLQTLNFFPETIGIEKIGKISYLLVNTFLLFYPLFLKVSSNSVCVIIGITTYIIGIICYLKSILDFIKSKGLVKNGIYRISRHPQAVSFIIINAAISILSNSLIYFILNTILACSFYLLTISEERHCTKEFGDAYIKYMNETPRFFLFLK